MEWSSPEVALGALAAVLVVLAVLIVLLVGRWLRLRRRPPEAVPETEAPSPEERLPAAAPEAPPAARGPPPEAARPVPAPAPAVGLRAALAKSRGRLRARLEEVFGRGREVSAVLDDLEEALIEADVGARTAAKILKSVRESAGRSADPAALRAALRAAVVAALGPATPPVHAVRPWVMLVSGVNGVGKTTTIGKLAHRLRAGGEQVLLVAADTFRAAAIDQLKVWGERAGVEVVAHQSGADPAAVAFDGMKAAAARGVDVVVVDTAGRLHTRENLMEELRKVGRVIGKAVEGAPHEVLLVLDGTTGQNAVAQAKVFSQALGVTGIVLTKLDGTAKGGAALAVRDELGVPILWVGVGEGIADIRPFDAEEFAEALVGEEA